MEGSLLLYSQAPEHGCSEGRGTGAAGAGHPHVSPLGRVSASGSLLWLPYFQRPPTLPLAVVPAFLLL